MKVLSIIFIVILALLCSWLLIDTIISIVRKVKNKKAVDDDKTDE